MTGIGRARVNQKIISMQKHSSLVEERGRNGEEKEEKEREGQRETGTDRLEITQPQAMSSSQIHDPYLDIKPYLN